MSIKRMFSLLLIFAMGLSVFTACGSGASKEVETGPFEATEGVTVTTDDGKISIKLEKQFIGEDAFAEFENIGEDPEDFSFNDDPAYKTVLFEFAVTVEDGEFFGEEVMGGGFYTDTEKTSEINDYICFDFAKNNNKAAFDGAVHMTKGESGTIYAAFAFPVDLEEFYNNPGAWLHYSLD